MKFLENVSTKISTAAGKTGLAIKKNSPEILLAAGVVTFVGTVIFAAKAGAKMKDIKERHDGDMEEIERKLHPADDVELVDEDGKPVEYTEEDAQRDRVIVHSQAAVDAAKAWAPVIALSGLSLACILVSRNIMQKRYLGVVAAYNALSLAYENYRRGVRERYGDQVDYDIYHGIRREIETITKVDENGKKSKEEVEIERIDTGNGLPSPDAVVFDSNNPNWESIPQYSMTFLRAQQNYANNLLHARGHLFLNEVYDSLGFPHTQRGAVCGWVDGLGDNFVDFGLYDIKDEKKRRFINGDENAILLDFNHDGVIYNKI